jgi:hypothetical protein
VQGALPLRVWEECLRRGDLGHDRRWGMGVDVDEGDGPAELGAGGAVAGDPWARHEARVGAAQERFDATAMVGRPCEEARACYLQQGFPAVLREEQGGGSVRGWWAGRVRLVVDDSGLVVSAYLQ